MNPPGGLKYGSGAAAVGLENTTEDGGVSQGTKNTASVSVTGPSGDTAQITIDQGTVSQEATQNTEVGAEAMIIAGFGGSGSMDLHKEDK